MRALLATLLALAPLTAAAPSQAQPSDLQQRRQQMLQISQQQRALIEQRLRCINQASTMTDLERCGRGAPGSGPMHSGSWTCPMW
jgi:hypothetical protein